MSLPPSIDSMSQYFSSSEASPYHTKGKMSLTQVYLQRQYAFSNFDLSGETEIPCVPSSSGHSQPSSVGFFQALTDHLGSLCACSSTDETPILMDPSERYWNDMDASLSARYLISNFTDHMTDVRRKQSGGQEECKEMENTDTSLRQTSARTGDDSIQIQQEFYKRGIMFTSCVMNVEEDDDSSLFSRGVSTKRVRTVSPTPDTPPPPPVLLRPRVALPSPETAAHAIPIEDDTEILNRVEKTIMTPRPMVGRWFHDVPFYTLSGPTPPPIVSADTYTTVSTTQSHSSLLDIEGDNDDIDDNEKDHECDDDGDDHDDDIVRAQVHRLASTPRMISDSCRLGNDECLTPTQPEQKVSFPPPPRHQSRYLARMEPSNYINEDYWMDHGLLLTMPMLE